MRVIELKEATGIKYAIRCRCGFLGESRATLAAAGAEMDAHQARMFPRPSERRECDDREYACNRMQCQITGFHTNECREAHAAEGSR